MAPGCQQRAPSNWLPRKKLLIQLVLKSLVTFLQLSLFTGFLLQQQAEFKFLPLFTRSFTDSLPTSSRSTKPPQNMITPRKKQVRWFMDKVCDVPQYFEAEPRQTKTCKPIPPRRKNSAPRYPSRSQLGRSPSWIRCCQEERTGPCFEPFYFSSQTADDVSRARGREVNWWGTTQ